MSSRKRGHNQDITRENTKHLKVDDDIQLVNDNNNKKVVNKQPKITENNSKTIKDEDCYSDGEPINRCIECGIDMGYCNPRQYCGKWKCNDYESEDDKTQ